MSIKLIEQEKGLAPTVGNKYKDGLGYIPSSQSFQHILGSISQGNNPKYWEIKKGELSVAKFTISEKEEIKKKNENGEDEIGKNIRSISLITGCSDETPIDNRKMCAWIVDMNRKLNSLSEYHADLFIDIVVQSMFLPKEQEAFWYDLSEFLDRRGLKKKTYKTDTEGVSVRHHENDILRAYTALRELDGIWVEIEEKDLVPVINNGKKGTRPIIRFQKRSRLISLLGSFWSGSYYIREGATQREIEAEKPKHLKWKIVVGEWVRYGDDDKPMIMKFNQHILSYDPYRQSVEKKLARYCLFHRKMHDKNIKDGGKFILNRNVQGLIDALDIKIDEGHPLLAKKKIEKALDQLKKDELIVGWWYPDRTELTRTNWYAKWVERNIHIQLHNKEKIGASYE